MIPMVAAMAGREGVSCATAATPCITGLVRLI